MKESDYEKLLNTKTAGVQKWGVRSADDHPYEPTPYEALEELFNHYELRQSDRVVDFGCGKGRLPFFVHYYFKASAVGVEKNESLYRQAEDNLLRYCAKHPASPGEIRFVCASAEKYEIAPDDNRFYFFNPFSLRMFMATVNRILLSYEKAPRETDLLLYYPSEDYIRFLEERTPFERLKEIPLKGISEINPNERFLVYRLPSQTENRL
jgi:SAM-dependent methyltransferase